MEQKGIQEYLMEFGLTRQEANLYLNLSRNGMQTGYEAAKQTGISRSNAYNALAGLVEKGAAYVSEGNATRYVAVDVEEFCGNKIRELESSKKYLTTHIPKTKEQAEGYLTVSGDEQIIHCGKNMLLSATKRVYLSMDSYHVELFRAELEEIMSRGIKVVIMSEKEVHLPGAKFYLTESKKSQIGVIADSGHVLTGELGNGEDSTCLFSGQANFVRVFKDSMKNEIRLIMLTGGLSNE